MDLARNLTFGRAPHPTRLPPASRPYWLTRFVVLRGLGFVYVVAFLTLTNQLIPLLGAAGLTPVRSYLDAITPSGGSLFDAFANRPTIFWLNASDPFMLGLAYLGLALAALLLLGYANGLLLIVLWLLYISFVHVGQLWYGFGWETMLLELGFLSIFLCPLLEGRPFPRTAPPRVVIWLLRWLGFRVILGAGLIKLRGDACWKDFTCLAYHFETQPVPGPLSWYFHNLPDWVLHAGVAVNHFVEVVVPFGVFGPRRLRRFAGVCIVLFQATLIASGNLSFLNWLTIVIALACFDDDVFRRPLPRRILEACERAKAAARRSPGHTVAAWCFAGVVVFLSITPTQNLLSSRQVMNTSFDRLHLVNSYGAFGSVGRERDEIVFQGTLEENPDDSTEWREYEWKCKPGDPMRRPCLITPYHYRLDWLIWFAAMTDYQTYPFVVHLAWKLLRADPGVLGLLAPDPFGGEPPVWIRAELYRYEFTDWDDSSGAWWKRRRLRSYLPAVDADNRSLRAFLEARGWPSR